jgi:hypothetical protein
MNRVRAAWTVLLAVATVPAVTARAGAIGQAAGEAAGSALARSFSAGPFVGGGFTSTLEGQPGGAASGGVTITYLGHAAPSSPDLALALALDGGYHFGEEGQGYGFVSGQLAGGWWLVTAGLNLTGAFSTDLQAFAVGPRLTLHLRFGSGAIQHELQVFTGLDLFVAGDDLPDQVVVGVRFLYDLV